MHLCINKSLLLTEDLIDLYAMQIALIRVITHPICIRLRKQQASMCQRSTSKKKKETIF